MISPVELRRIISEWRLRVQRVKDILQPPTWNEREWRQFSQTLALLVREHGKSWIIDPNVYWDLRWKMVDGGELVCQIEHIPGEKTSLVVAQNGGFADNRETYTWLFAEFDMEGQFARDPYWVDGMWKEALAALLIPLDRQSSYMLVGRSETPDSLLLQEGARPNDGQVALALMLGSPEEQKEAVEASGETPPVATTEEAPPPAAAEEPAPVAESPAESSPAAVAAPLAGGSPGIDSSTNGAGWSQTEPTLKKETVTLSSSENPGRLRRERAWLRHFRSRPKAGLLYSRRKRKARA